VPGDCLAMYGHRFWRDAPAGYHLDSFACSIWIFICCWILTSCAWWRGLVEAGASCALLRQLGQVLAGEKLMKPGLLHVGLVARCFQMALPLPDRSFATWFPEEPGATSTLITDGLLVGLGVVTTVPVKSLNFERGLL